MKNRILKFVQHLVHPVDHSDPEAVVKEAVRILESDGNYYAALDLLKPVATGGHPLAQTIVGGIFRELTQLPDHYAEAVRWFEMAAAQDFPLAQMNLGIMFLEGHGVPRDLATARFWFQKAAQNGQPAAQYEL